MKKKEQTEIEKGAGTVYVWQELAWRGLSFSPYASKDFKHGLRG